MNHRLKLQWDEQKSRLFIYSLMALYVMLFLPFWKPVVLGFLFASAVSPLLQKLRKKLHTRSNSVAYILMAIATLIVILILCFVVFQAYSSLFGFFQDPEALREFTDKLNSVRDQILVWAKQYDFLSSFNTKEKINQTVNTLTSSLRDFFLKQAQEFLAQAPETLLAIFIFILSFVAFLVLGTKVWTTLAEALQLNEKNRSHFLKFERICAVSLGSVLITGAIQSFLVCVGVALAGIKVILTVFVVTFVFSLIPILGAGLVPLILAVFSFLSGEFVNGGILLFTSLIVGVADNILRAWLFSRAAQTNPALSMISLLGGISLMGFAGLFIAPVIEQLVMTYSTGAHQFDDPGAC